VISSEIPSIAHHIACPDSGIYWRRFHERLGAARLCPLPHRSLSIRAFLRMKHFARDQDIQVIHCHGTCAGVYGRLLGLITGLPVVHSFHGVPVTRSLKHALYDLAERPLGWITQCGVAVSAGEADLIHSRWRHYRGKLAVVPNGIDLGPLPSVQVAWPTEGPIRIVSFSRKNHQKYPELLIEIARILHLQGIHFHIDAYGEGLADEPLTASAARRGVGDQLRFLPPTDDPIGALSGAHIYLSTSRWEGMPLAILEAWRAGLVVVASDVIGNRDLVKDGQTGRLFPAGDGRTAARIIRHLVNNRAETEHLRQQAARHGRVGHGRDLMAMRLEWIYRRVAKKGTFSLNHHIAWQKGSRNEPDKGLPIHSPSHA
jgi:glycosyltransferase involved in cell wall biosynthesis